jgi:hypothetical protein
MDLLLDLLLFVGVWVLNVENFIVGDGFTMLPSFYIDGCASIGSTSKMLDYRPEFLANVLYSIAERRLPPSIQRRSAKSGATEETETRRAVCWERKNRTNLRKENTHDRNGTALH